MDNIQLVQALMVTLDKLSLRSVSDWEIGVELAKGLIALKRALEEQEKAKKQQEEKDLEERRAARQKQLQDAQAAGLEVIGGETIKINSDGSSEVVIP
jgi:PIN domain nuclease of toxin-antitoxin system